MATVKCKEPGCPCEINTKLYCQDVTSWLGLRYFLENENLKHAQDTDASNEISKHLNLVNLQLKAFKIKEEETVFQAFSFKKASNPLPVQTDVKELYLTCAKNHSYYYDVDCKL